MKNIKSIFIITFLFSSIIMNAQKLTLKQQEYEKNKVQIFTSDERDNLQRWFIEEVDQMCLTEAKNEEYFSILLYYNVKMTRLDDKDMEYTKEEINEKFDKLLAKQDVEIKKILSEEKYKMHIEVYDELLRSIRNRMDKTKD